MSLVSILLQQRCRVISKVQLSVKRAKLFSQRSLDNVTNIKTQYLARFCKD